MTNPVAAKTLAGAAGALLLSSLVGAPAQAAVTAEGNTARQTSVAPYAALGLPITDVNCSSAVPGAPADCQQTFTHGAIFWNELTGMKTVQGAIYNAWKDNTTPTARGASIGELRPVSDEVRVGIGSQQNFALPDGGRGTFFTSPYGTFFVDVDTAAGQFYINNGGAATFGFPTGAVTVTDGIAVLPTTEGAVQAQFAEDGALNGVLIPLPAGV